MQLAGNLDLLMLLLLEEEVTATPSLSPETALLSLSHNRTNLLFQRFVWINKWVERVEEDKIKKEGSFSFDGGWVGLGWVSENKNKKR
jgi:hypothetical protein